MYKEMHTLEAWFPAVRCATIVKIIRDACREASTYLHRDMKEAVVRGAQRRRVLSREIILNEWLETEKSLTLSKKLKDEWCVWWRMKIETGQSPFIQEHVGYDQDFYSMIRTLKDLPFPNILWVCVYFLVTVISALLNALECQCVKVEVWLETNGKYAGISCTWTIASV